jgi:small-conductance mechanosensitive channel
MNVQQINTALIQGSFTNEQLSSVIDAVKFARSRLAQQTKYSLRVGDTVEFTSSKNGMTYTGTVQKIAIKFVTVKTAQGLWRVPANMLAKVADNEFA